MSVDQNEMYEIIFYLKHSWLPRFYVLQISMTSQRSVGTYKAAALRPSVESGLLKMTRFQENIGFWNTILIQTCVFKYEALEICYWHSVAFVELHYLLDLSGGDFIMETKNLTFD